MESAHTRVADFLSRRADAADATQNSRVHDGRPDQDARRVMTRAEAHALAEFVREVTTFPFMGVIVDHTATAVATQRFGHPPKGTDVDALRIGWNAYLGSAVMVDINTNVRDPTILRRIIQRAMATQMPRIVDNDDDDKPDATDIPKPAVYLPLPVPLWHPRSAVAMAAERGSALAQLSGPFHGTAWRGTGTVAVAARSFYFLSPEGNTTVFGESTDCEVSITARSVDGSAAGWSGQARRDWDQIKPTDAARAAIARAEQQQNPSRFEPGRYTAILSATAVGQLLRAMARMFNVRWIGPFNPPQSAPPPELETALTVVPADRRGQRVFDPRITLSSDPTDPEGGDFPFFYGDGGMGTPNPKSTWIENGVLKLRSVDAGDALQSGMIARKDPFLMRMSGGPTSVEEMIASCERGIYVHRFANLEVIDGRSGAMSGFTRDGCLLIMNGKVSRPIKDFRIFESPFLSMNRVLALGKPERVAFGFTPPNAQNPELQWPLPPIIAPPMMVTDFNFAALSDAV